MHARGFYTLHPRDMTKTATEIGRALYPEAVEHPHTRAECVDGPRPCPYVSCRHHLAIEANPNGSITFNFRDVEPDEMAETCSLDVADRGPASLDEIAAALNLTREAVRLIEMRARAKARALAPYLRDDVAGDVVRLVVLPDDDDDIPEAAELAEEECAGDLTASDIAWGLRNLLVR